MSQFQSFSVMHPAHLEYLSKPPTHTLDYFFDLLENLEPLKRDKCLEAVYVIIISPRVRQAVTGKETVRELLLDEVGYDIFRHKVKFICQVLDGRFMVYGLVMFTLQQLFNSGNVGSIGKRLDNITVQIEALKKLLDYKQGIQMLPENAPQTLMEQVRRLSYQEIENGIRLLEDRAQSGPARVQETYELYKYFCENVVGKLNAI